MPLIYKTIQSTLPTKSGERLYYPVLVKMGKVVDTQKIGELINDFTAIEISPEGKGFSKLIMLYHPDKLAYYQNEIKRRVENNDFDGLLELSHIIKWQKSPAVQGRSWNTV